MADNVQWIKFKVGTFDGHSFKKIKRAKINGVANFRDKLTAVWFELLDLSGQVNNGGLLTNDRLAFSDYEEIAIALDRTEEEIKLCVNWYITNNMMEIIDDLFLISNWTKYQNIDALSDLREKNRIRQQRYRDRQKQALIETQDIKKTKTKSIKTSKMYFENKELNKTFNDYLEMRVKIKAKATQRAIELVILKLEKLSQGNDDIKISILEQSIMNSWKGVFPLKQQYINDKKTKNSEPEWMDDYVKNLESMEDKS